MAILIVGNGAGSSVEGRCWSGRDESYLGAKVWGNWMTSCGSELKMKDSGKDCGPVRGFAFTSTAGPEG